MVAVKNHQALALLGQRDLRDAAVGEIKSRAQRPACGNVPDLDHLAGARRLNREEGSGENARQSECGLCIVGLGIMGGQTAWPKAASQT